MKKRNDHNVMSNILFTLKNIWRVDKGLLLAMIAMVASLVLQPLIAIYMPKFIIQYFEENRSLENLLFLIGQLGLASLVVGQLKSFSDGYFPRKSAYYRSMKLASEMALATLHVNYKYLSSEEGQDQVGKARRAMSRPAGGIQHMVNMIVQASANLIGAVVYILILSSLNPLIIIALIACGIVSYIAGNSVNKYRLKINDELTKIDKKRRYVNESTRDIKFAKDIKVYGMYEWLKNLGHKYIEDQNTIEKKISFREFLSHLVDGMIALLRDGFAYLYLIYLVINGSIEVSEFILYIGSIAGFSIWVSGLVSNVISLGADSIQVSDFRVFMDIAYGNMKDRLPHQKIETPITIELKDICFSYNDKKIYDHFNLKIEAGKKIALVGVNGAGKTTLIKLIMNLIEPDSGQILINGIDHKQIDMLQYFELFSVAFQDALVLSYGIDANISMKSSEDTDQDKVDECIKLAGLEEKVTSLKAGKFTSAGRYLDTDGTELSGGERQKLILARALYKDAPILILDEPSSALDPIAESDLYEKYHDMTKDKTSIYISHRLSSTKFCDHVLLLENGRVVEEGKHEDLMSLNGKYAQMFDVQSHYYKDEVEVVS